MGYAARRHAAGVSVKILWCSRDVALNLAEPRRGAGRHAAGLAFHCGSWMSAVIDLTSWPSWWPLWLAPMLWPPSVLVIVTVIAGLFFYWLRCKTRRLYGFCEVLFSFIIMYIAYFPNTKVTGTDTGTLLCADDCSHIPPSVADLLANELVLFLGSVYVFVRGCDNMGLQDIVGGALHWTKRIPIPPAPESRSLSSSVHRNGHASLLNQGQKLRS